MQARGHRRHLHGSAARASRLRQWIQSGRAGRIGAARRMARERKAQANRGTGKGTAMNADPESHDAAEIIRGLSSLPGGISVEVTSKRFPRLGPAEPGTGYVQQEQSF